MKKILELKELLFQLMNGYAVLQYIKVLRFTITEHSTADMWQCSMGKLCHVSL